MTLVFTVTSSEGEDFTVEKDVAFCSLLLRNILEDIGPSSDPIPLPNVSTAALKKVLEYCTIHCGEEPPDPDEDDTRKREITFNDWECQFIAVDQEFLFEIILAANYLDIKGLIDLGCKQLALMIQGKSTEEI
ncbi:hypothetical protein GYMLUDRAFT_77159 [Collybiopsis luxurians FD-317 M1]|uniref:E3 ubiquitin ligase complex SCF subunit n=1 Tax=Collybiopsis luxurians FD-317 M1 TaxID=944289 RepID=A0A0D0AUT6_9AGAR|nr:hypothetical protein GYMLUDRAFT_77159 [Collybiopsis luxurians FD-317 M1]